MILGLCLSLESIADTILYLILSSTPALGLCLLHTPCSGLTLLWQSTTLVLFFLSCCVLCYIAAPSLWLIIISHLVQDPKEKAKSETRDWLNNVVCWKLLAVCVLMFPSLVFVFLY
jgi:hypothetical protein